MTQHTFHIPVMGLGFTIDTPLKVARFGISSVVSIMHDTLLEQMREFYSQKYKMDYTPIIDEPDYRAKRITAYLNLMQTIIDAQVNQLKSESFLEGTELDKYFRLLPETSEAHQLYLKLEQLHGTERAQAEKVLRQYIIPGSIDVNIMTKLDRVNYAKDGTPLPLEFTDANAALRGFTQSNLKASVVFSAGLNPRLYAYLETMPSFFPDEHGMTSKSIILKVSDFRSALIQGKYLAKKGMLVKEFRIESGLNCGGHAFPTDGFLLGPILEEFKNKKKDLQHELLDICNQNLQSRNQPVYPPETHIKITVQGGIGTSSEDQFLREHYHLDGTGWGSPFLLVPEVTNVDDDTLQKLSTAQPEDYYLSNASPLGVPFNNFKDSSSELQRKERINKNRPGSPCYRKHLTFNTEFTSQPICTASREYQDKKLKTLDQLNISAAARAQLREEIIAKDCLCEGLAVPALLKNNISDPHHLTAVAICPGPNLAFFSGVYTLEEMVGHIYGRCSLLNQIHRPHIFINELKMYIEYFKKELTNQMSEINDRKNQYLNSFASNILEGITYYRNLLPLLQIEKEDLKTGFLSDLDYWEKSLQVVLEPLHI